MAFDGIRLFCPKAGLRHFITITPLYAVLRLESYKGFPGKWFYESRSSWVKSLAKWGFDHQILASAAALSEDQLAKTDDRFLASTAVSVPRMCAFVVDLVGGDIFCRRSAGAGEPQHRIGASRGSVEMHRRAAQDLGALAGVRRGLAVSMAEAAASLLVTYPARGGRGLLGGLSALASCPVWPAGEGPLREALVEDR